ncbi:DNA-binding transcriptional activator BglJ [Klebsiella sp. WOUb02]|uniref:DNA-binding transcriptional activator BglJ n=1 Tax=Klebsiella sp. WOUb02 TaxID=3161071 RepID=UPI003CF14F93
MERNNSPRYVAVVEKCMLTELALRHILTSAGAGNYIVRFFKDTQSLRRMLRSQKAIAVIFSLFSNRLFRMESLLLLHEIACATPEIRRIVLAHDSAEARLVRQLTPSSLHGVLNKSICHIRLQEQLIELVNQSLLAEAPLISPGPGFGCQILSPTEQQILRYMTCGYSLPEIAARLDRNIKTIRAHKFNAMTKLGVSSDIGLLSAADILMHLSALNEDAAEECLG